MDLIRYYNTIAYISAFSVVVPLFVSSLKLKTDNKSNLVIFVYLLVSLSVELINYFFLLRKLSNTLVVEFFKLLELYLLTYLFYIEGVFAGKFSYLVFVAMVLSLVLFLVDLKLNSTIIFNGFSHCLLMSFCLLNYYRMLNNETHFNSNYLFWVNTGILFYFSISFFLFMLSDFTESLNESLSKNLWFINLLTNMLYYVFLSVGLWRINNK